MSTCVGLLAMRETRFWSLGWEDPMEEDMIIHSSVFAWRIPKNRGAWKASVHVVAESDTTGWLSTQHTQIFRSTIIGSRGECVILLLFSCVWLFATLTLCNPMDCSLPGSFVYEISQARILEWVAISFSRGSSWSRDWTQVSCIARWILYHWVTREGQCVLNFIKKMWKHFFTMCLYFFFLDQQCSRIPGASQP